MRLTDGVVNRKIMRQNGPDMVIQGARCDECKGWREFDAYPKSFRVNGYDVFVGPTCRCERSNVWVLYYVEAHLKDAILI